MPAPASAAGPGRIPGQVDLGGADIRRLEMSGDVFVDGPEQRRRTSRSDGDSPDLNFFGARVGLFDLREPFPEQVNMTGLRVERWHGLKGAAYEEMLRRMVPLDTSVYTAIEQSLRLEGNDPVANRVYVAMRRRMYWREWRASIRRMWQSPGREAGRWLHRPVPMSIVVLTVLGAALGGFLGNLLGGFAAQYPGQTGAAVAAGAIVGAVAPAVLGLVLELFLDLATGYWTVPYRLLLPIAVSLVVGYGIANAPQNYEPSDRAASAVTGQCASAPLVRGMNLAVPIIDWMLDPGDNNADHCRLKQTGDTRLNPAPSWVFPARSRGLDDGFRLGLSPLSSALVLKILGWLLWPMLLVGMSVRMRGRTKQAD